MSKERFAGLPDGVEQSTTVAKQGYVEYDLPVKKLGLLWDMEDKYQTFRISELTPAMQHAAAKTAKDNASVLQQELMFKSVTMVGDTYTASDRDFLEAWWRAIGPKCRMLVTAAFGEMVSVDEEDTDTFLATGRSCAS